jgi:hypothetical protein
MSARTVEDRLREEYFALLPDARRVAEELEAEVRHCILPLSSNLHKYEKIEVVSRVKDCERALGALRRRQEGGTFDPDLPDTYALASLNDLAGVRVLAFPRHRWIEADATLRRHDLFSSWKSDPIVEQGIEDPLAYKYHGFCSRSARFRAELQIAPMLIGLFWQVEHSAVYKPAPQLKGVPESLKQTRSEVYKALRAFEAEFERLVRRDPLETP